MVNITVQYLTIMHDSLIVSIALFSKDVGSWLSNSVRYLFGAPINFIHGSFSR
jgi:hypothetical protein